MRTLRAAFDDYLEHMHALRKSRAYIRVLRFCVIRLVNWLAEKHAVTQPQGILEHRLTEWRLHVCSKRTAKGLPRKASTIAKQLDCDRSFLEWLEQRGEIPKLSHHLESPKVPSLLPTSVLTHAQMMRLLRAVDTTTSAGFQLRAMLETLYTSGVRVSELLDMNLESLDLANGMAKVFGKGAKERMVPIGETAVHHIETFLKAVRPLLEREPGVRAVWLDRAGRRMPYHTFRRQIVAVAKTAKLPVHVTAHTFRRTCATELIRGEANLWHVKDIMGHENLDTLNAYTRLTIVDLRKTHAKCHPRERDRK